MNKYNVLVVGGASGLGLGIVNYFTKQLLCNTIYVVDKQEVSIKSSKIKFYQCNLSNFDLSFFKNFNDIEKLFITVGFGRVSKFNELNDIEIYTSFRVNIESIARILRFFYSKINSPTEFTTCIISSIAGRVVSPLMSIYGATKAALSNMIQSLNIELYKNGIENRILEVCPGFLNGTSFYGNKTNLNSLNSLIIEIINSAEKKELLFIPEFLNIYEDVLLRNFNDYFKYGAESYDYKISSERIDTKKKYKIGYLSGTFDLFHIGHLNLLEKAKNICDYLIVGVHRDGSHKDKETFIAFDERKQIIKSIKYVDEVVEACKEDNDAYELYHYDFLFVGSDYKGTSRFERYEKFFKTTDVQIIYFPYTKGTSSTFLRGELKNENQKRGFNEK